METKSKRPFGVSFLGWFNAVGGALIMLAAPVKPGPAAAILFVAGLISVVLGVGLLRLRGWARLLAIICYALGILGGFVPLNPIRIIVPALFLVYLCTPQIGAVFADRPSPKSMAEKPVSKTDQKAA
ncbi:MAG TPA: hypothetical protein VGX94_00730 [Terriglobia bacterium]|nr:hypothetical protein [Terriglobia bacterium]